eukprot:RCo052156
MTFSGAVQACPTFYEAGCLASPCFCPCPFCRDITPSSMAVGLPADVTLLQPWHQLDCRTAFPLIAPHSTPEGSFVYSPPPSLPKSVCSSSGPPVIHHVCAATRTCPSRRKCCGAKRSCKEDLVPDGFEKHFDESFLASVRHIDYANAEDRDKEEGGSRGFYEATCNPDMPPHVKRRINHQLAWHVRQIHRLLRERGCWASFPPQLTRQQVEEGEAPPQNWTQCWRTYQGFSDATWTMVGIRVVLIGLPCTFPCVLGILGLFPLGFADPPSSVLQIYFLVMYIIFFVLLGVLGFVMLAITNEDSISGMVAQRYNKVSYLTILLIAGLSFFTSAYIAGNGIARDYLQGYASGNDWLVILGSLSPLFSSMNLIFPLVVNKTARELFMIPLDVPFSAPGPEEQLFQMIFIKGFRPFWHRLLHYCAVVVGLVLGYLFVIYDLVVYQSDRGKWVVELLLLVISASCLALFFVGMKVLPLRKHWFGLRPYKISFYFEFLGLFYYVCAIVCHEYRHWQSRSP